MIDDKFKKEVKTLKGSATSFRNRGKFEQAHQCLDQVIMMLENLLKASDEEDQNELRGELADTYGMKGGVYRRQGGLLEALSAYSSGRKWETIDNLSSYNLSNIISLKIHSQNCSPDELREEIEAAIKQLQRETQGTRKDEWWAWADLAQFYILQNKPDKARECYEEARSKTGATKDEIGRHLSVLNELGNKLHDIAPAVSENIKSIVSEL